MPFKKEFGVDSQRPQFVASSTDISEERMMKKGLRGLKDFLTSPIEKYRPVAIIIFLGLVVWIIELYLFFVVGIRQAILAYYVIHIFFGVIALAVVGRKEWKSVLLIVLFYMILPNIQFYFDALLKNTAYGLTKGIGKFLISAFLTPIPFMIWFLYGLIKSQSKAAHRILVAVVIFWVVIAIGSMLEINAFSETIGKVSQYTGTNIDQKTIIESFNQGLKNIKEVPTKIKKQVQLEKERSLEYATSGYYQGKVEEGAKQELGVFIEQIKPAQTSFFDDEEIILWATLRARTLDEKKLIYIYLKCLAGEEGDEIEGEIQPSNLKDGFEIITFEDIDVGCRFKNEDVKRLEVGIHPIKFVAEFNFSTQAYLKTYFMDNERKRAMIREGIDIFKQYGIADTSPIAQSTKGPVKIGAETTKSLPIGIGSERRILPRLGITIENLWQGNIKKITGLKVKTPEGIVLKLCPAESPKIEISEQDRIIMNSHEFDLEHSEFKEHIEDVDKFFSINCIMDITNPNKLLGNTPISIRYINIETDYNYTLETAFNVEIKKSKIPEQEEIEEFLRQESENFDINIKNIDILKKSIEGLIQINDECINRNKQGAIDKISILKIYTKESIDGLKEKARDCAANPFVIALDTVEGFELVAEHILKQYNRALLNLKTLDKADYDSKKASLNTAISEAKSELEKAVKYISKKYTQDVMAKLKQQKVEDSEIETMKSKIIKIKDADLKPINE